MKPLDAIAGLVRIFWQIAHSLLSVGISRPPFALWVFEQVNKSACTNQRTYSFKKKTSESVQQKKRQKDALWEDREGEELVVVVSRSDSHCTTTPKI